MTTHAPTHFDQTPATHGTTCPFCKRSYEVAGVRGFAAPRHMVCTECSTNYEAKVVANFELTEAETQAAYRVARLDKRHPDRLKSIALWVRLGGEDASVRDRVKYLRMIELVRSCDRGITSIPAVARKEGGWR